MQTRPFTGVAPLLERERELGVLGDLVVRAAAGGAGVALVEGPAGIGKSRLLAAARQAASESGFRVLAGRGGEIEREFPFGVVRQLFEPVVAEPDLARSLLEGAAGAARPVFETFTGLDGDGTADDTGFAALHGLYWLTVNLSSESPLLLSIDDLHWCDRSSLRFLAYLVRRLEGLPVLVAASLRPSEPGADAGLLAELAGDPLSLTVLPGPLSSEAVTELMRHRLGDRVEQPFADACHAATGGNPLLLGQCLKALEAERVEPLAANAGRVREIGPRAAGRALLQRLARLPRDAVDLARALAVVGDCAALSLAARLAEIEEPDAARAVESLIRAEILRPELPLGFVHPLVQAAVYHDISPIERGLQHERAARLLLELEATAEQIAAHLLHAPERGEAAVVDVLRSAAQAALKKGAPDNAIASLVRALAEPPAPSARPRVLAELGFAEMLISAPTAKDHLRAAYESLTDPVDRARAAEGVVRSMLFTDDAGEAAALARRAVLEIPVASTADLGHRLEALELLAIFFGARADENAQERLVRWRHERAGEDIGARMLASVASWAWTLAGGAADEVSALALWAHEDGRLLEADSGLFSVVASIPLALAGRPESRAILDAILAEATLSGSVFALTGRQLWGGYDLFLRGELEDAEADVRAAHENIALWGVPASAYSSAFIGEVLVERGALAEARAVLEGSEVPPANADRNLLLHRAWALLLVAEGRSEDALRRIAAFRRDAAWRAHPVYLPFDALEAMALDRLGRSEEALVAAARQLDAARRWGSSGAVGAALRVLGAIDRVDGLPRLHDAVAVLEGSPARLELAKALAALGMALRRDRRPTDAREPLRRALELADACGAHALAEMVRAEIYATGARPRTTALRGVEALTSSERRVAELAAAGSSNRDIAQALYVTPKTVEVHLSSTYRKLGIASRRDLQRVLTTA